jgi:hypothetical protein
MLLLPWLCVKNYRRLLDREDAQGPANVAVIGNEGEVACQLRAVVFQMS